MCRGRLRRSKRRQTRHRPSLQQHQRRLLLAAPERDCEIESRPNHLFNLVELDLDGLLEIEVRQRPLLAAADQV